MTHEAFFCDVLVVGGGGAGVISSIIASKKGLDVVLATRCSPVSGNTRLIGGVMALPDEGDVDAFLSDLEKSSCGIGEPKLRKRLIREIAKLGGMFRDTFGLDLSNLFRIKLGGHSTARSVAIPGSGQTLNLFLKNALLKSNVKVISFQFGCRFKKCGLCAVEVDGKPVLSCAFRIPEDRTELEISPLKNLSPIKDLVVDRSSSLLALRRLSAYPLNGEVLDIGNASNLLVKLALLKLHPGDKEDRASQARELGIHGCASCRGCYCPFGVPIRAAIKVLSDGEY